MTGEEKFNDFRQFLFDTEQKIRVKAKTKEEKGFKFSDIFFKYDPKNKKYHQLIQKKMLTYGLDEMALIDLVEATKKSKVGSAHERGDYEGLIDLKIASNIDPYYSAEETIYNYVCLFYRKHFRIIEGQILPTGKDKFEVGKQEIPDAYMPLIITQDGTCHRSWRSHEDLAKWLTAQGISIKDAVRGVVNHKMYTIDISSINPYEYSSECDEADETMALSFKQAHAIKAIYEKAKGKWTRINSLNSMVSMADIFGTGSARGLSDSEMHNLRMFEEAFKGEFSVSEYARYLRQKFSQFEMD